MLNGVEILNANLDEINKEKPKHNGAKRRSGHICFCGHGSPVKFRNITILELPESVSLFNGKDLTGWKKGTTWRTERLSAKAGTWSPKRNIRIRLRV